MPFILPPLNEKSQINNNGEVWLQSNMTDFLANRAEFLHYANRFCPCKEKKLYVYFKDSIGQSFFFPTLILEWCLEPMTFLWILSIVTKLLSSECI